MLTLLTKRVAVSIPLLVLVSFIVYSLVALVPGNPAVALAGENPDPADIQRIEQRLGLDDPFFIRYGRWLLDAFTGDFGNSLYSSQSVWGAVMTRLPVTISLIMLALTFALITGVLLGSVAGLRPGSVVDRVATLVASIGLAVPYFWVGMVLILLLSIRQPLFPAVGYASLLESPFSWFHHLALPAFALGLQPAAMIARQARASMRDTLQEDYIRTARAKGLPPTRIIGKHGLKNAAVPIVTVGSNQFARLVGSTVVIEQLFALPGVGKLALDSVFARDLPMVQGVVLTGAALILIVNVVVDVSYGYFNPKVRHT